MIELMAANPVAAWTAISVTICFVALVAGITIHDVVDNITKAKRHG